MKREKGSYEYGDILMLSKAYDSLKHALRLTEAAGAPKTAERIRLAISSMKGAIRHCDHRFRRRQERAAPALYPAVMTGKLMSRPRISKPRDK